MQHFLYKCCILSFFLFLYKKETETAVYTQQFRFPQLQIIFYKNAVLYFLTRCLGRPFTKSGCSSPMISGLAYFS